MHTTVLSARSDRRAAAALFLLAAIAIVSCQREDLHPSSGTVTDAKYRNAYFKFSVPVPAGWHVASTETEDHLRKVGSSAVVGDDPLLKAAVETAAPIQLLTATEHPVGSAVPFNSSFLIMAERVSHAPGIKTGEDYLFQLEALLERSPIPYEPLGEVTSLNLDGHTFARRDFSISALQALRQSYIVGREGDYVLAFVFTAADQETLDSLVATLADSEFE